MLSEDYVLRQVGLAVGAILQLLGLKRKSKVDYDAAYSAIDQAMTSLVGLGRASIPLMDDSSLANAVESSPMGREAGLVALAKMIRLEGDVLWDQERQNEARERYSRALGLLGLAEDEPTDEIRAEIEYLVDRTG